MRLDHPFEPPSDQRLREEAQYRSDFAKGYRQAVKDLERLRAEAPKYPRTRGTLRGLELAWRWLSECADREEQRSEALYAELRRHAAQEMTG